MQAHHIDRMMLGLQATFMFDDEDLADVRSILTDYWHNKAAIVWIIEDIWTVVNNLGISDEIDTAAALRVLAKIENDHDASVGVNWDVIEARVQEEASDDA